MKVDAVAADAHGIGEPHGSDVFTLLTSCLHACFGAHVLFEDGELGTNASRFPDVGILGQTVLGADDVIAEPQAAPARLAFATRRFRLHPVQQRQAELLAALQVLLTLLGGHVYEVAEPVVVLGPVHQTECR